MAYQQLTLAQLQTRLADKVENQPLSQALIVPTSLGSPTDTTIERMGVSVLRDLSRIERVTRQDLSAQGTLLVCRVAEVLRVQFLVRMARNQLQVLRGIVQGVMIDMMNMLVAYQWAPQNRCHHFPMFQHRLPVTLKLFVPPRVDRSGSRGSALNDHRAVLTPSLIMCPAPLPILGRALTSFHLADWSLAWHTRA